MPYGIRAALRASVQRLGSLPSEISLRLPGRALASKGLAPYRETFLGYGLDARAMCVYLSLGSCWVCYHLPGKTIRRA